MQWDNLRAQRFGLPFAGKVTFGIKGQERSMEVVTENISATGGSFISNDSPTNSEPVEVHLYWQPRGEPEIKFNAVGTVARVDHFPDNTWRFAVTFEGLPERQESDEPPC